MIEFVQGDIFSTHNEIIVHGVNTIGGFASGIAGQIARKYPYVREHYLHKYNNEGWSLGDVQYVLLDDTLCPVKYIVNAATQLLYGRNEDVVYVDYNAIATCLEEVLIFASREKYSVSMPRIGCGLGNGEWGIIRKILVNLATKYENVNIKVYSLE